jgi:hypothetical protein
MWTLDGTQIVVGDRPKGWRAADPAEIDACATVIEQDVLVAEAKKYLASTDYKMLSDYTVAPDGEPLASIQVKRATAREYIRTQLQ